MSTEPRVGEAPHGRPAVAFISLLRDDAEARGLAGVLEGLACSDASTFAVFLTPEVRGVDFFAAAAGRVSLDRWWELRVPANATPVYLLGHQPGLASWLVGLGGDILVAAAEQDAPAYSHWTVVLSDAEAAPLALAQAVITRYSRQPAGTMATVAPRGDIFDRRDARRIARIRNSGEKRPPAAGKAAPETPAAELAAPPPRPYSRPQLPPLLDLSRGATLDAVPHSQPGSDPLELLAADSARLEAGSPMWAPVTPAGGKGGGRGANPGRSLHLPRLPATGRRRGTTRPSDAELAALLLARAPTIVVVGSRKGGVGKTSHAAGVAITAGEALDTVGHMAALVDANIANPDAWGQLNLPSHAATVRDVVAALGSGAVPPPPIHSATPALACYPERRDGVDYSRTDIRRLATHLRARYSLTIVDMSNRLPDPMSGPEASVAASWLAEADALVLPTAMSRQDFNGVLDYLDVRGLPPTVVPCIVSSARRNRRHPMTREYLELISSRVDRLLEIPDEADKVRLAGMEGVPVQEVSARMRSAYRALTEAVVRLPMRSTV